MHEQGHVQRRRSAQEGDGTRIVGPSILVEGQPFDEDGTCLDDLFQQAARVSAVLRAVGMNRRPEEQPVRGGPAQRTDEAVRRVQIGASFASPTGHADGASFVVVILIEREEYQAVNAVGGRPMPRVRRVDLGVHPFAGRQARIDAQPTLHEAPGEPVEHARRQVAVVARRAARPGRLEREPGDRRHNGTSAESDMAMDVDDHIEKPRRDEPAVPGGTFRRRRLHVS